jgi:ABC-type polysaccharide/polyol phosphate export permease
VTALLTGRGVREDVPDPDVLEETHEWGPLRHPRQAGGLGDVIRQRYLLWLLLRKEAKVRSMGSFLGLFWSYAQPATRFCVYYFIAAGVFDRGNSTENKGLHIFSGMIIMTFFTEAMGAGARSVVKNKSLMRKVNIPRELFPVASVCVSIYNMFPMYVVLLVGDFLFSWHPDAMALPAALLAFAISIVYALGFALMLSAVHVYSHDVSNAVGLFNTVIRWTAPVIYTYDKIKPVLANHEFLTQLYVCNPFNAAVMLNNRAFWVTSFDPIPGHPELDPIQAGAAAELPDHLFERGILVLLAGVAFVFVAQLIFSRVEGGFADKL